MVERGGVEVSDWLEGVNRQVMALHLHPLTLSMMTYTH